MDDTPTFWARLGADRNGDGEFTIGDVGPMLFEFLIIPGDTFVYLVITYAPGVAEFFELGANDYGGIVSLSAAALIWLTAIFVAGTILSAIRDLDRKLTTWFLGQLGEVAQRFRVLRRLLVTSLRMRSWRKAATVNEFGIDSIELGVPETTVLRCLSSIDDGAVLTLDEIAAKLGCSNRAVIPMLRHLIDLALIEHGTEKLTRREGHRIATAGQMYLLGA